MKIEILEKYLKMEVWKLEFWRIIWEWNFKKLNLKIEILENYLKMEVLEIKFENWNFGKIFENGSLKIKFEIWNFRKLFENGSFEN